MKTATRQRLEIIFCTAISLAIGAALGYNFGVEAAFAYAKATLAK